MASPLAPYINSRVLAVAEGAVSLVNGRYQAAQGDTYLIRCFMKRAQYTGVSSGSKKIPLESQLDGEMMPGASGDQFYYRGYALEYSIVSQTWNPEVDDESSLRSCCQAWKYDSSLEMKRKPFLAFKGLPASSVAKVLTKLFTLKLVA